MTQKIVEDFSELDRAYMAQALEQAELAAQQQEVPVGAVVVYQQQVIALAHNSPIADCDPCAHAEVKALRQAGKVLGNYRLIDCTLYVSLEPCPMCAAAMVHARIKRLVYGAADPRTGAADSVFQLLSDSRLNHQVEVTGGVMADVAGAQLQQFFRQRRAAQKQLKRQAQQGLESSANAPSITDVDVCAGSDADE